MSAEDKQEDVLPPLKLRSPFEKNVEKFNKQTFAPDVGFIMEGMDEPILLHTAILGKTSALLASVFQGQSTPICVLDEEKHLIIWKGAETEDVKVTPEDYRHAIIKVLRFLYGEDQSLLFEECAGTLKGIAEMAPPNLEELVKSITQYLVECAQKIEILVDDRPEIKEDEVLSVNKFSFAERKVLALLLKTNSTPTKELTFSRLDPEKRAFGFSIGNVGGSTPQLNRRAYSLMISEILQKNTTITSLHVESFDEGTDGTVAILETLKTNTSLTELSFDSLDEIEEKKALGEMLKVNKNLRKLSLKESKIGCDGADCLRDGLLANTALTELDLTQTRLGPEGARSLGEALAKNTTLTKLNLEACELGPNGASNLCQALKSNNGLHWLSVARNQLGPDAGNSFGDCLNANKSLTSLSLSDNELDNELGSVQGSLKLVEGLKGNKIVSTLDLSHTGIGHEGTAALCEHLKNNTSITALDLSCNTIGRTRTKMLSEMLKVNSSLQKLNLYGNRVGDNEAKMLCEALRINKTLQYLDVRKNRTEIEGVNAFKEILKENRHLKQLETSFDQNPEAWTQAAHNLCPVM